MKDFFQSLKIKIKKNFDAIILHVPNSGTSTKKFHVRTVAVLFILYTAIVLTGGFYAGVMLKPEDTSTMSESDISRINSLNKQVLELTAEIEGLKESNRKLRNAILLADSNSFRGNKSSRGGGKLPKEGNILYIFNKIFENLKEIQQESYYFIKPSDGFISRSFNAEKGHFGIDFVLKTGNAVYSSGNGYVAFADYTSEDGFMLIINHSDDYVTVYKHCSVLLKKQRDFVIQGELIALSGNTGNSSGPHLHFEIWKKGMPLDPKVLLLN